jgi:predicted GIY-YIG superfamily endonuclease
VAFYVYILRCVDYSYYVGHTDDLDHRIAQHHAGEIAGYTQNRRPVRLVFLQEFATRQEALAAEGQLKGWSRAKKEALILENWGRVKLLAQNRIKQAWTGRLRSPSTRPAVGSGRTDRDSL